MGVAEWSFVAFAASAIIAPIARSVHCTYSDLRAYKQALETLARLDPRIKQAFGNTTHDGIVRPGVLVDVREVVRYDELRRLNADRASSRANLDRVNNIFNAEQETEPLF